MRPFYLLSAAAIVAVAWLVYTKFLSKDGAETQLPPAPAPTEQAAAANPPAPKGLSPEQIRNRKAIIKTYERQIRESRSAKEKKDLQDKINAIQKEIAGY